MVQYGVLARLTWWEYSWDSWSPSRTRFLQGRRRRLHAYSSFTKQEYVYNDAAKRSWLMNSEGWQAPLGREIQQTQTEHQQRGEWPEKTAVLPYRLQKRWEDVKNCWNIWHLQPQGRVEQATVTSVNTRALRLTGALLAIDLWLTSFDLSVIMRLFFKESPVVNKCTHCIKLLNSVFARLLLQSFYHSIQILINSITFCHRSAAWAISGMIKIKIAGGGLLSRNQNYLTTLCLHFQT